MPTSNPPESAGTGDLLRVALPNKGALSEDAVRVFTEAGYRCKRGHSSLRTIDSAAGVEFIFLRPRDIAVYVGEGVIDVGVSGRDLTLDSRANVEELLELQFGHANFRLAVPRGATLDLHADPPTRIATSFTHLLADYLAEVGSKANIIALDGAVELAPSLGVADAVADVVQTSGASRSPTSSAASWLPASTCFWNTTSPKRMCRLPPRSRPDSKHRRSPR